MIRKFFYFFLLFLVQIKSFSQTYRAIYDCTYFSGKNTDTQMGFDVTMKIRYTVYANEKYIEINGKLIDATTFAGMDIGYSGKDDKAIIDIEQRVIYFPVDKVYRRIKPYRVDPNAKINTSNEFYLVNADSSIMMSIVKKDDCYITPGLFLLRGEHMAAVENIKTPTMTITLIECKKEQKRRLDYSTIFKDAAGKAKGIFDFFQ